MSPLRDLQERFAIALFDDAPDAVASWVCGHDGRDANQTDLDAYARLSIYRNNLREGFIKALALEFPVIERLVGGDYFRQLALDFLAAHPSRAGDLHHIGEPFPQFLLERFAGTSYAYLSDVAVLEWTYQQVLIAPDGHPFDPATLRGIPAEAYGLLRFNLSPACGLVRSPYPVTRIWAANQPEAPVDEVIDLSSGPDSAVIRRAAGGVEIRTIAAAEFAVLHALSEGMALADALAAALAIDPDFDLTEALRRFISLGILAAAHISLTCAEGISS